MFDAMRVGTAGMLQAMNRLDATAGRVARLGTDLPEADAVDPAAEIAGTIEVQAALEMNAAVVRSASDMQTRTLDILV